MMTSDLTLQLTIMACALTLTMAASIRQLRHDSDPSRYGRSYFITYGCERRDLVLSCGSGGIEPNVGRPQKISIVHAIYGRQNLHYCPTEDLNSFDAETFRACALSRSETTYNVSQRCNGRRECDIPVQNDELGGDPCPGIYKYLQVYYACSVE